MPGQNRFEWNWDIFMQKFSPKPDLQIKEIHFNMTLCKSGKIQLNILNKVNN